MLVTLLSRMTVWRIQTWFVFIHFWKWLFFRHCMMLSRAFTRNTVWSVERFLWCLMLGWLKYSSRISLLAVIFWCWVNGLSDSSLKGRIWKSLSRATSACAISTSVSVMLQVTAFTTIERWRVSTFCGRSPQGWMLSFCGEMFSGSGNVSSVSRASSLD